METRNDLKRVKKIDNWSVSFLDHGAYGLVYETRVTNGESYILKLIVPDVSDKAAFERFNNEVAILKQLDHVSIPKFIAQGTFRQYPYVVMQKMPGKTLRKIIDERNAEGEGAVLGEVRVINILAKLLEALEYLHAKNIQHRDIKHDNVLTNNSDSHISIIDFGVGKGENLPNEINTFRGGVGSSRFCPPAKLRLGDPEFSHEIFAVGVIGYLLLTNKFPWEVNEDENVARLAEKMEITNVGPLYSINSSISKNVSDFILSLLDTEDHRRPDVGDALNKANKIKESFSKELKNKSYDSKRIVYPHVILDTLYRDIRMTHYEWSIINTKEFQRLRYIKQLGFTNYVYPGAEHTRFAHAIGTLAVSEKVLTNIETRSETSFTTQDRLAVRCYSLVHDISHIAFGHTLEDELNFFKRHDENSDRIKSFLFNDNSELGNLLRVTDFGREILQYFEEGVSIFKNPWISEIIESPFGSDVLDYIDRDSLFCGLDHRVDSAIYRRLNVRNNHSFSDDNHYLAKLHGNHGYRIDADFSLESIFRERYALFLKVYTHPAKIAASAMLGKAMSYLIQETSKTKNKFNKSIIEWFGDITLLDFIASTKNSPAGQFGKMLINRSLYKPIFRSRLLDGSVDNFMTIYDFKQKALNEKGVFDPEERSSIESILAAKSKVDERDIIIYCTPKAPGIQKIKYISEKKPGIPLSVDESSPISLEYMRKHLGLWFLYVFVNPTLNENSQKRVADACESYFSIKNEIEISLRQQQLNIPFNSAN